MNTFIEEISTAVFFFLLRERVRARQPETVIGGQILCEEVDLFIHPLPIISQVSSKIDVKREKVKT